MVQPPPQNGGSSHFISESRSLERQMIAEMREPELTLDLDPRTSKIVKTRRPVARFSITHPGIVDVVQFGPTEFELIGLGAGETSFTMWFAAADGSAEKEMLRYLVRVSANEAGEDRMKVEYAALERKVNELFPNSYVRLFAVGNKLIIRGQARDSREAADILQIVGGEAGDWGGWGGGGRGYGGYGYGGGYGGNGYGGGYGGYGGYGRRGTSPNQNGWGGWGGTNIINMLEVPGEKQVMLKVRVAELTRSALRDIGSTLNLNFNNFSLTSSFGSGGGFNAILSTQDVQFTLDAVSSNGFSKILAEPNLVTLSGHSAYFISGGEFAVPTVVGVQGASAIATSFRGFGTQLTFTPTVLDKDRIRLEVQPSFSSTTSENSVDGIPGLTTRSVSTTVDLREGQWLAIAGLIQDQLEGSKARVPFLGDIPVLDMFFSKRHSKRDETELLVLVSPELVHPLEPEEAPLILPGMEVTEPTDFALFIHGDYEGRGSCDHRSTVWPLVQRQGLDGRWDAKRLPNYQRTEGRYIQGPHGFSQ